MIAAIVWDYDGTLVDTQRKNLNVTRAIVERMTGVDPSTFLALQSGEGYAHALRQSANWREFYKTEFGFDEEEIDAAGREWTESQLRDSTPTPVFEGIHDVLHRLRDLPHGIVSQSSREAIKRVLEDNDLLHYFSSIVGFEEVEIRRQKPEPDGLLRCVDELTQFKGDCVLSIGDHETDAASAHNANVRLQEKGSGMKVRSIGARYSSRGESLPWRVKPDYEAQRVQDILSIVDSVKNAAALHQ